MSRLFGTDGIRGVANKELTCELAFEIGKFGALVLTNEVHKPRILIGRDTRISGEMLVSAISAGICSVGAEAINVGIIPTPGLAYLARRHNADAGVVISASHNSFEFNGIKWVDKNGCKLSDEVENEIAAYINKEKKAPPLPTGENVGRFVNSQKSAELYIEYLLSCVDIDLAGMSIVLDCANGAASEFAPAVFRLLGAKVFAFYNMPDGININAACGSTYMQRISQLVVEKGADIGFSFDGDADRMLAVDEYGVLVDGDSIMGICALELKRKNALNKSTLVTTVMSNIGLSLSMKKAGINVEKTDVGDRYVLERMREGGYNFGGEQSGHLIFADKSTTGDGILSALELVSIVKNSKKRLSTLSKEIKIFPQILINITVDNKIKNDYLKHEEIVKTIQDVEKKLGETGRVLVRSSGTEPLVRVMIEGKDENEIRELALSIAKLIEKHQNGKIR